MATDQDIQFDTWQTEQRSVEVEVPVYTITSDGQLAQSGTEKAQRVVDEKALYTKPIPHSICGPDSHYFAFVDGGRRQPDSRILVKCTNCPYGKNYVLGINKLENGKLSTIQLKGGE